MFEKAERAAAPVVKDRRRSGFPADRSETLGGEIQRFLPGNRFETAICSEERRRQPVPGILRGKKEAGAVTQETPRDGMVLVPPDARYLAVLDCRDNRARVRTVTIANRLA